MRKQSLLGLLLCALMSIGLTSCLSDDDNSNNGLTKEQIAECYNATRGSYNGNMVYKKDATSTSVSNNDTVAVSWSILTDSTMNIYNVPAKAIASVFTDSDIKQAVSEQADKVINCAIAYYNISNGTDANTKYITWLVGPMSITYDNVTYKGETHKVQVSFYASNYYSFGMCNTSTRKCQMQLILYGAYIDGKYNSTITSGNGVALYFYN